LKPASHEFPKAFARKPVQITICIEHPMPLSNHLAENLQPIRKAAANFLLHAEMDCHCGLGDVIVGTKEAVGDGMSPDSDDMV